MKKIELFERDRVYNVICIESREFCICCLIVVTLSSGLLARGPILTVPDVSTAAAAVSYTHLDVYKRQVHIQ